MRAIFGGLVALILLALYCYSVFEAVKLVLVDKPDAFTTGYSTIITTVGGLVSALVIAELTITKPGEVPVARVLGTEDNGAGAWAKRSLVAFTGLYLLAWVAAGLTALVVGFLWYPGKLQNLTDVGQAWLGLAAAAAYAYFGVSQK